jgi:hypothetical protein
MGSRAQVVHQQMILTTEVLVTVPLLPKPRQAVWLGM